MSNLTDIVAERRLVACVLHGRSPLRDEARAILELFPPTTVELRELLKGRKPRLHAGIAEERNVGNEWPVDDTLAELAHRLWLAQARRDLMKVAMTGTEEDVRRAWAVLQRYEQAPAAAVDFIDAPGHRSYLGDELPRVKDPFSAFPDPEE